MSELDFLEVVTAVVREEVLKVFSPDSCVASTWVLTEVLSYFGYTSEPLPVVALVFNEKGFEMASQGVPPSEWPDDAWSVGVEGTGVRELATRRWDGHLVALVNGNWLIDPSLDQFSRPQRGMATNPAVLDAAEWTVRTKMWCWRRADGVVIGYRLMEKPGAWRDAPDWGKKRELRIVAAAAIKRLKAPVAV